MAVLILKAQHVKHTLVTKWHGTLFVPCHNGAILTLAVLLFCREAMKAIGGMYVLNSGTLIGPSQSLIAYFQLMMKEFEVRWHCMRLHGSDQAVHNYLVYTGKLIPHGESVSQIEILNLLSFCIEALL